jgi:CRISPR-associated exonuclease Cas4
MDNAMIYGVILLIILGILLLWQAGRRQREVGLPAGRISYDDASRWNKVEKNLYDATLGLTGKPDYILEKDGFHIPVEVKSSPAPLSPYDNHVYQLAAYCMLVEQTQGVRPPYGILRYRDRTFEIDYTEELEHSLLALLDEMRRPIKRAGPPRSHQEAKRCSGCGYRSTCDQVLKQT